MVVDQQKASPAIFHPIIKIINYARITIDIKLKKLQKFEAFFNGDRVRIQT